MKASLERFKDLVQTTLGLALAHGRDDLLVEIISSRAEARKLSVHDYLSWLDSYLDEDEVMTLAKALTVGETYFFRDAAQLEAFDAVVVRRWAQRPERNLRVLSAGCASGEEPYSLAMLVRERYPELAHRVEIDAWDINGDALSKARLGIYTAWSLRETPAPERERWFTTRGKDFILKDELRQAVNFSFVNLAALPTHHGAPYDAIFCRNVVMYFTPVVMSNVVEQFAKRLVSDGHLFLGHAETLRNISSSFVVCCSQDAFYYRRKVDLGTAAIVPPLGAQYATPERAIPRNVTWLEAIERATSRVRELSDLGDHSLQPLPAVNDLSLPMQLLREEQFGKALQALRDLPGDWSHDPDALLLEATLLVNAGELDSATQACGTLLHHDDLNAGAHYLLGVCCEGAKDLDQAVRHHNLAVHLDARFAMPRVHLGLMSRRLGRVDQAKSELRQAIEVLEREDPARLVLFGGGFSRAALLTLCRAELDACGGLN